MTTFDKILLACPHCKSVMYAYELMSYTVHSAKTYSDGRCVTDSFITPAERVGICHNCSKPFWKEDAHSNQDPYSKESENLPNVLSVSDMTFPDPENYQFKTIRFFEKLIKDGFANTMERKIYLRITLWWAINDLIRDRMTWRHLTKINWLSLDEYKRTHQIITATKNAFDGFEITFRENLKKLTDLLWKEEEVDFMTLAEIYRELGNYSKALSSLKKMDGKQGKAYKKIRNAVLLRRKKVFLLS